MSRLRLAFQYGRGWVRMRRSDVLVASFPRSGSTRLRMILAAMDAPDTTVPRTHDTFERRVPEVGAASPWDRQPDRPLFLKSHRPYSPLLARPRAVLLLRHPLDALISFHAYRSALIGVPPLTASAFLRDARHGLPRWIAHTRSWRQRALHTMTFNALCQAPESAVTEMMEALGIELAPDALRAAIGEATPEAAERLRRTRVGGDQLEETFVFARANSHQPRASFSEADEAWALRQLEEAGLMPLVETL